MAATMLQCGSEPLNEEHGIRVGPIGDCNRCIHVDSATLVTVTPNLPTMEHQSRASNQWAFLHAIVLWINAFVNMCLSIVMAVSGTSMNSGTPSAAPAPASSSSVIDIAGKAEFKGSSSSPHENSGRKFYSRTKVEWVDADVCIPARPNKKLRKYFQSLNVKNYGCSIGAASIRNGDINVVREMIRNGFSWDDRTIAIASMYEHLAILQFLLMQLPPVERGWSAKYAHRVARGSLSSKTVVFLQTNYSSTLQKQSHISTIVRRINCAAALSKP